MKQIAVHLKDVPDAEVIQRATTIHTSLTGNPNVPNPFPTLTDIQAGIAAAKAVINDYEAAKTALRGMKAAKDDAIKALVKLLQAEAVTVQIATGGDPEKVLSTGYKLKSDGSPVGRPVQPQNFVLMVTAQEGALKAKWKPVRGVSCFDIQISAESPSADKWVFYGSSTKAKALLKGLTSGTRIWVRVRGVGAAGEGVWSQPVGRIVP